MSRLFISFSGGETSAYMTHRIMADAEARERFSDIRIVFANTGEEHEKTLEFVDRCDKHFGWGVVWIEAVVHPGARRGTTSRVVDFTTASRNGEPFEAVVRKYGVPNSKFPNCTRELKLRPLQDYARRNGWPTGSYDTAIGIRADEFDRCAADATALRLVYPLATRWPTTKPQVNAWWAAQPFRLGLKGYEGNCKWCWKKSLRKHMTLMVERPEVFDFPARMEQQYGHVGPEFRKSPPPAPGYRRTFFRDNRSVSDVAAETTQALIDGKFEPARDDAAWTDPALDGREGGCAEACEVFT